MQLAERQRHGQDQDEIEDDCADGDGDDAAFGVQRRGNHRDKSGQHDIGRSDGQIKRRHVAARLIEPGRNRDNEEIREPDRQHGDDAGDAKHRHQALPGQSIGTGDAVLALA